MKKAPLYPILCGREFGAAALHVPSLLRWVASKGLYLHTEPPIGDYEIMQVEALLCDIERGAKPDNYEEAGVLVSCTPELAEHSNDPCSVWLVGAEAHRKWRDLLREAFKAGELQLLDFASLLPLKADEVHVTTAPTPRQPAEIEPEQAQHQGDDQQEGSVVLWQDQVREIADELHRKDLKAGAWSSIEDISERVAAEAIKRGILGSRGKLTAANIRREALQGGRWKRPTD
ncbi:MAG: hypothetical protein JSR69_21100 [Proteobacteria bacterium]|nr:hypothetical protein [Pseudomonadota bacterium]